MKRSPTSLTSLQQQVLDALAAGASLSAAADAHNIDRVTIYRWMKSIPEFAAVAESQRGQFTRDLHKLSTRAIEVLVSILDNPKTSPGLRFKAAELAFGLKQSSKSGERGAKPFPVSTAKPCRCRPGHRREPASRVRPIRRKGPTNPYPST